MSAGLAPPVTAERRSPTSTDSRPPAVERPGPAGPLLARLREAFALSPIRIHRYSCVCIQRAAWAAANRRQRTVARRCGPYQGNAGKEKQSMDWKRVERKLERSFGATPRRYGSSLVIERRRPFPLAQVMSTALTESESDEWGDLKE